MFTRRKPHPHSFSVWVAVKTHVVVRFTLKRRVKRVVVHVSLLFEYEALTKTCF